MPEIKFSLTKWWHYLAAFVATVGPIVTFTVSGWLWLDARYMHREISDTRYINLQIQIIQGHVRDYHRLENPTPADTTGYELDLNQLKNLQEERNKILGIGGLPE